MSTVILAGVNNYEWTIAAEKFQTLTFDTSYSSFCHSMCLALLIVGLFFSIHFWKQQRTKNAKKASVAMFFCSFLFLISIACCWYISRDQNIVVSIPEKEAEVIIDEYATGKALEAKAAMEKTALALKSTNIIGDFVRLSMEYPQENIPSTSNSIDWDKLLSKNVSDEANFLLTIIQINSALNDLETSLPTDSPDSHNKELSYKLLKRINFNLIKNYSDIATFGEWLDPVPGEGVFKQLFKQYRINVDLIDDSLALCCKYANFILEAYPKLGAYIPDTDDTDAIYDALPLYVYDTVYRKFYDLGRNDYQKVQSDYSRRSSIGIYCCIFISLASLSSMIYLSNRHIPQHKRSPQR